MSREFTITPAKTYATIENARKAVVKSGYENYRHFYTCTAEGRWFPVFVGLDAQQDGVHFHWHVVG